MPKRYAAFFVSDGRNPGGSRRYDKFQFGGQCPLMPFILAKTVTYVSSLPVTYLTSLYTSAARERWIINEESGRPMVAPTFSFGTNLTSSEFITLITDKLLLYWVETTAIGRSVIYNSDHRSLRLFALPSISVQTSYTHRTEKGRISPPFICYSNL